MQTVLMPIQKKVKQSEIEILAIMNARQIIALAALYQEMHGNSNIKSIAFWNLVEQQVLVLDHQMMVKFK